MGRCFSHRTIEDRCDLARRRADEGGDLVAVKGARFGQLGEQGVPGDRADPGDALQPGGAACLARELGSRQASCVG